MTDEEIIRLYKTGLTVSEVIKRSGRPPAEVRAVLLAAGFYRRA